ncbi:non-homologous end-joining DNA ligase [Acidobacterium sp. S8]|uniref:non-homologous end-joining DNA ligase n=1 Tax=Acidobacterium sp. S8 TaxID=1641854 RepID=UPI00131B773D|nr:non-homologous end-joining DNA ligase [Acidobacterium sp. S8]
MSKQEDVEILSIDGYEVRVTHPGKLYFSREVKLSKLELVRYYLAVAPGALNGIRDRPIVLKRFVNGAEGEAFYQKRAPSEHPEWLQTVTLSFPSGRTAEELVVENTAGLAWIVNLGCIELHPHAIRSKDLNHPDELRIDLDPGPGIGWADVRRVALEVNAFLEELGLRGWPKTSGSRGMHINVRIEPRWTFDEVRRAALALSREIERRAPALATSKWWKEERHGVFLDYNQNAKDRTTASAYSVRPLPDARVSTPLRWDEVAECDPADFTVLTVPKRFAEIGDPHANMDSDAGSLEKLLDFAARDDAAGLGDAPWPPHFKKTADEKSRVAPSRAKKATTKPREKMPLLVVANSPDKAAAIAGLERWKASYPKAAQFLAVEDVLIDSMRGRSSTWTRVRVNLRNVPEDLRPDQGTPDPDDDPTRKQRAERPSRKRKAVTGS